MNKPIIFKAAIFIFTLAASLTARAQSLHEMTPGDFLDSSQDMFIPKPEAERQACNISDPLIPEGHCPQPERKIEIPGINSTLEFAVKYRQTEYSRHDLQGDMSLVIYTKAIPKVLFKVLFGIIDNPTNPNAAVYNEENPVEEPKPRPGNDVPDEETIEAMNIGREEKERLLVQLANSRLMIEGRVNPLRVKNMLKMFTQIIYEERLNGIEPKYGEPHEWSPEFRRYAREHGEIVSQTFSKVLTALSSGVTARYFHTGKEKALINYVLSRPYESVTLHELFRKSYRLNGGDVYLAILTPLNVFSDAWRHPERENLAITRRLSLITNFYNGRGDKFGSWYHLYGIMLYGYVKGGFRATIVGNIESMGSHILGEGPEYQEDHINSTGGKIGAKLAKIVKEKKYLEFDPGEGDYCDAGVYLNLDEDFRDRIKIVNSEDFETTLSFNRLWIKSLYGDYLNCKVEIMYNDHTGRLNSGNLIVKENVSILKGETFVARINSFDPVERARAFITGCSNRPRAAAVEDYDPFADDHYRNTSGKTSH